MLLSSLVVGCIVVVGCVSMLWCGDGLKYLVSGLGVAFNDKHQRTISSWSTEFTVDQSEDCEGGSPVTASPVVAVDAVEEVPPFGCWQLFACCSGLS